MIFAFIVLMFGCVSFCSSTYAYADAPEASEVAESVVSAEPAKKTAPTLLSKRWDIDKIVARVNGVNILLSDLQQPRIVKEGGKYTLDEAIVEELFYQRAAEAHMLPTAVDVERQLVSFKIQNNLTELTDKDFEAQLKVHGFTLKSYKRQLGRMIAAENVKRIEINEKIVVTTQEVEAYYNAHPEHTKEEYKLKVCTLSEEQLKDKDALIKDNKLDWDDLGWVARHDIGKNFSVVFSMKPGSTSEPIKSDDEYQLVQLIDKRDSHLKTLTERYGDIERHLQDERKDSLLEKIEKELVAKAIVERL